jgi:hypothetical protein
MLHQPACLPACLPACASACLQLHQLLHPLAQANTCTVGVQRCMHASGLLACGGGLGVGSHSVLHACTVSFYMSVPQHASSLLHCCALATHLPACLTDCATACFNTLRRTSCRIPWPKPPAPRYPQELHSLVGMCLTSEHSQRPTVLQLLERVQELMAAGLPDPS